MAMRLYHKALASALFLIAPGSLHPQASDNPLPKQQNPLDPSVEPLPSVPKAKKVWTNDNLSSLPGQVSVVGTRVSSAQQTGEDKSSSTGPATFLTPPNHQVVHPGEIVHFDLSIAPGRSEGPVRLVGPLGVSMESRNSPPYTFTLEIPRDELRDSGRLIGLHSVSAFGKVAGKQEWDLGSIELDVEEEEMPTKLELGTNATQYGPLRLKFFGAGEEIWLSVEATFPNGDKLEVIDSTYLKLVSEDPKVISVDEEGRLISLGPGTTSLTVTYTLGSQTMQVSVPASVTVSNSGLVATPSFLDFGDQAIGTSSDPRQVALTNHAYGAITIYKFEIRAEVRESDNCTSAPLPPDGACTISVTFLPSRRGPSQGLIYIPNGFSGQVSLPIIGNGI